METVKSEYHWVKSPEQRLSSSQASHGQAALVDVVQKRIGGFFLSQQLDPQLYVCKRISCGNNTSRKARNAQREYNILKKLQHPFILTYADFEYNSDWSTALLYTEFCASGDLGLFLPNAQMAGQFTEIYAKDVTRQISSALAYLHHGLTILVDRDGSYRKLELAEQRNDSVGGIEYRVVLHRDIKPPNIFIRKLYPGYIEVQLGDFGLAKELDEMASQTYVGTKDYIAPECRRAAPQGKITPKSDVWAFGTTLRNLTSHLNLSKKTTLARLIERCCEDDYARRPSTLKLIDSLAFDHQEPLLHAAIEKDWPEGEANILDIELIERLLDCEVDVNVTGNYGETALHLVSWGGGFARESLNSVAGLLKIKGANINAKDSCGLTPSDWEAFSLRTMQKQVSVNFDESCPGRLGFHYSNVLDCLLDRSVQDYLPAFLAAASGNIGLLRIMFLRSKLMTTLRVLTLCTLAAQYGHVSCFRFLLESSLYNQRLKYRSFYAESMVYSDDLTRVGGLKFLHKLAPCTKWANALKLHRVVGVHEIPQNLLFCAIRGGKGDVVQLLIDTGEVGANSTDETVGTALSYGASLGQRNIVKLLLENGADVNAQCKSHGTALEAASKGGHERIVGLLLDMDADVNAQFEHFDGALPAASEEGHESIVKLLLDRGADINPTSAVSSTALQAASRGGHESIVELLLGRGADVHLEHINFGNALQIASDAGHEELVIKLLEAGAIPTT